MALTGSRTYVGFGFGAIQAGLFLYEAFRSGNFRRLVVAEVVPSVAEELRRTGGFYAVNIAAADGARAERIGPVEVLNPSDPGDRERLLAAIAAAEEMATAVPSVDHYARDSAASLHRVLADGLALKAGTGGPRAVIYAAENHNSAAEILEERVLEAIGDRHRDEPLAGIRFLNTVIGKMSGLAPDGAAAELVPATPGSRRAFLVEEFNRILISRVDFAAPFRRGIETFEEKDNLLPFEEAKLHGHNAIHVMAACLGRLLGRELVCELRRAPGVLPFLRDAFVMESGEALCRKHRSIDSLFTPEGYAAYADDLLERMTNAFLMDTLERVSRDLPRKLGWDDRLIGTMRLVLGQGVLPRRFAVGAAAALATLDRRFLDEDAPAAAVVEPLWGTASATAEEYRSILSLIESGRRFLRRWRDTGFPDLQELYRSATTRAALSTCRRPTPDFRPI